MTLNEYMSEKGMSCYALSKASGIPKTTIIDICAGRSSLERCSAITIYKLSKALDCSMEDIMSFSSEYDEQTGLPNDKSYLESGLPPFLEESLKQMKKAWKILDSGDEYPRWDCEYCDLQSSINIAEVSGMISSSQATYLRERYLRQGVYE